MFKLKRGVLPVVVLLLILQGNGLMAQTDEDAIMMSKNNFCVGPMYGHSSWDHYWEGTYHRSNANLGTVTTQMVSVMGIYGITRKLNVMVSAPYIWTKPSAGTLHGEDGIQDLSAWVKWEALEEHAGRGLFSVFLLGGASVPLTDYNPNYLPMSIGLQSKTLSARLIADYQLDRFFVTASGTYTWRSNITIDQNAYYTTSLHLTDQVDMPNVASEMLRIGYRHTDHLIAEAIVSNMNTLGGFDMRKNDMPFPSNKMNSTVVGAHVKYSILAVKGLSVDLDGGYTVAGRNVGQSTSYDFGVYYVFHFGKKISHNTSNQTKTN
ncbi:MAG TPA: hypothetical protein VNU70_04900 [Puia sp.]|jgi:hypothetical protein|nr:hypothetical protein [Puia sp.]